MNRSTAPATPARPAIMPVAGLACVAGGPLSYRGI